MRKEKTEKNPADILTKAVDTATLLRQLETCGLVNKKTLGGISVLEIVAGVSVDTMSLGIAVGISFVTAGAFCAMTCWRESPPATTPTSELARADTFEVGTQSHTTYARSSKRLRFRLLSEKDQR